MTGCHSNDRATPRGRALALIVLTMSTEIAVLASPRGRGCQGAKPFGAPGGRGLLRSARRCRALNEAR